MIAATKADAVAGLAALAEPYVASGRARSDGGSLANASLACGAAQIATRDDAELEMEPN